MRLLPLAFVAALGAGCLEDQREGQGAGYVVGDGASSAEVVRVAWMYVGSGNEERALLHGEAPVEDGSFDIDLLVASHEGFEPPARGCPDLGYLADQDRQPGRGAVGVGRLVATAADLGSGGDDVALGDLPSVAVAAALEMAVVWSSDDFTRDSLEGQRLESALSAGFHLARLHPCQFAVECQGVEDVSNDVRLDQCVDPWPNDGLVLLEDWDGRF